MQRCFCQRRAGHWCPWSNRAPSAPEFDGTGYTLQLNNPSLLAEHTAIAVVADFRSRDVAAVLGMETALRWIETIGYDAIAAHEHALCTYATEALSRIEDIRFFGQAKEKASVISFLVGNIHPYDLGTLLDKMGIAVRTGHHCAQPLMDHLGLGPSTRASFAAYNTSDEVERLVAAVAHAVEVLR